MRGPAAAQQKYVISVERAGGEPSAERRDRCCLVGEGLRERVSYILERLCGNVRGEDCGPARLAPAVGWAADAGACAIRERDVWGCNARNLWANMRDE